MLLYSNRFDTLDGEIYDTHAWYGTYEEAEHAAGKFELPYYTHTVISREFPTYNVHPEYVRS